MEAVGEAIGVFLAVAAATSFFLGSDLGLGLNLDLGELNNETRLLGTFDFLLLLLFSTENTALFFISLFSSVLITFLSMAGGVVMIFSVVDFGDSLLLLLVFNLDLVNMLFLTLGLNNFFLVSKILGLGVVVDLGLNEVLEVSRIFGSSGDSTMRNGTCSSLILLVSS